MNKTYTDWKPRRIPQRLPIHSTSSEEKAARQADSDARYLKAREIFERVRDRYIRDYYNWYITIEPNTEEYFFSQDEMAVFHRITETDLAGKVFSFRLNETGVCGSI